MSQSHFSDPYAFLESATGPIQFNMTNDYMFKAVLQRNNLVLVGLIAALLHLTPEDVKSAVITNPIKLGDAIDSKSVILDVNVLFNNSTHINLEMQVVNHQNWVERSAYYLCRNFSTLQKGDDYQDLKAAYQIGILDFTLFPEEPFFYATNLLMNQDTHKIYTDKLRLSVLDLRQIELATEEDRRFKIDRWAQLFKATTWEDLKMYAESDSVLTEAGATIYEVSQEEHLRQVIEAREDAIRQERGMQRLLERTAKERDEAMMKLNDAMTRIAELEAQLEKKD